MLVVAGEKDTWTPFSLSTSMHEAIPGSELLVLPAGTHTGPLEHPELVALRLEKFLAERVDAAPDGGGRHDPHMAPDCGRDMCRGP